MMDYRQIKPESVSNQEGGMAGEPTLESVRSPADFHVRRKPLPEKSLLLHSTSIPQEADEAGWQPFYLKPWVLVLYCILFCLLLTSVAVISYVSQRNQGLADLKDRNTYLWKYGPTVFVVINALWGRTIYQAKMITPWIALRDRPGPAEKTILLDYVSALEPVALIKSIRGRDFLVTTVIAAGLLLKLLIVFSAALVSSQMETIRYDNISLMASSSFIDNPTNLKDIGSLPYYVLFATQNLSLPFPDGTNREFAFPLFNSSQFHSKSRLEATVDAFTSYLDCEPANMSVVRWNVRTVYNPSIINRILTDSSNFESQTCSMYNVSTGAKMSISSNLTNTTVSWLSIKYPRCEGEIEIDTDRILISSGEARVDHGTEERHNLSDPSNPNDPYRFSYYGDAPLRHRWSNSFICRPVYRMTKLIVSINETTTTETKNVTTVLSSNVSNSANTLFTQLRPQQLAQAVFTSSLVDGVSPSIYPGPTEDDGFEAFADPVMLLGLYLKDLMNLPWSKVMDRFTNSSALLEMSQEVYRAYTVQIARSKLMDTRVSTIDGSAIVDTTRLAAQKLSVVAMEVMLAILILLLMLMFALTPKRPMVVSNPSTLVGLGRVLEESSELVSKLRGTSSAGPKAIPESLMDHSFHMPPFQSHIGYGSGIHTLGRSGATVKLKRQQSSEFEWWQPMLCKYWFQVPIFVSMFALVITLEILLRRSSRSRGLYDVTTQSHLRYLWLYFPTLSMVLIAIYFSALDVSVRTIAPYQQLRHGCSWLRSFSLNLVDRSFLTVLVKALSARQYAVFLMTVAAFLGSFLSIVISGLFTAVPALSETQAFLQAETWFTAPNYTYSTDPGYTVASVVLQANLSYLKWTFEGFTFPSLTLNVKGNASLTDQKAKSDARIKTRIPAIRASYQCRLYTQDQMKIDFNVSHANSSNELYEGMLVAYIPEEMCASPTGFYEAITPYYRFSRSKSVFGHRPSLSIPGCSHHHFWWGSIGNSSIESITALGCNESYYQLEVGVTFSSTSLQIKENDPPEVDDSTQQKITFQGPIGFGGNLGMAAFTSNDSLDNFFSTLIHGRYGIPQSHLTDPQERNAIADAVKRQMQVIRAQELSETFRMPVNDANVTLPLFPANITSRDRMILRQNEPSTRAVQGLLVTMLILGIIVAIILDTRRILPFEPTSIAAMASLLADSNLLNPLMTPEGIGGIERREQRRAQTKTSGIAPTYVRMGWFDTAGLSAEERLIRSARALDTVVFTINKVESIKNKDVWNKNIKASENGSHDSKVKVENHVQQVESLLRSRPSPMSSS